MKYINLFIVFLNYVSANMDYDLIYNSLILSQNTYCNITNINCYENENCNNNKPELYFQYENKGSKVIGGYMPYENNIFISYRGSSNIHNWINNIEFTHYYPYDFNNSISVEKGFYTEYKYTKDYVVSRLEEMRQKYNTKKLLVTGHSGGASLSTLLVYDYLNDETKNIYNYSLVTFGSPRIGNLFFVDDFNNLIKKNNIITNRITHYYDIVPHLPQEFLNYLHIPNEIWFDEQNYKFKICDDYNNTEDKYCSDSCGPIHCTSVDDHLYYLNLSLGSSNC